MEGIQHRLECPAKDGSAIGVVRRWFTSTQRVITQTRCRECGRAALIRTPMPEGPRT